SIKHCTSWCRRSIPSRSRCPSWSISCGASLYGQTSVLPWSGSGDYHLHVWGMRSSGGLTGGVAPSCSQGHRGPGHRGIMPIRHARTADIPYMVAIAETKRVEYEGYSPVFWRKAPDASPKQERYLQSLLTSPDVIALVAQVGDSLVGFVIGVLT